jgi:tripartite ATP-independent transporter DctP family solute receptor
MSKSVSMFVVGLLTGVLLATGVFALFVRGQNLAGQESGQHIVLKLGHSLDTSHPVHAGMVYMAQELAKKSGGSVVLEIYPNGQLGSETECIEQLQRGALAMTKTSAAPMEGFIPEMGVFGIPYIFRDADHYWRVLEGPIGKELALAGEAVGLRGLCYYDAGSRSFYTTNTPVLSPDDLTGLKIRVMKSKTMMDMVDALGGSPTPIPWGELYTALQQKMVDGAENNLPSFYTNRHFEVARHFSIDEHSRVPDILLMSSEVWKRLPVYVQQWVQESADASARYQRDLWAQKTAEALEAVEKEGVKVYYPDKGAFVQKVTAMHKSYAGTPLGRLLNRILETE